MIGWMASWLIGCLAGWMAVFDVIASQFAGWFARLPRHLVYIMRRFYGISQVCRPSFPVFLLLSLSEAQKPHLPPITRSFRDKKS